MQTTVLLNTGTIGYTEETCTVGDEIEVFLRDENGNVISAIGTVQEILETKEDWD